MFKKRTFFNILAGCLLFSSMTLFNMEPEQATLENLTGVPSEKIV